MTNVEGQMIENLKWSAEVVCSVYHVPPYKVGVGALPSYNNVQALNVEYYSQALQSHIEEIEELLDHALGIGWGVGLGTEFDTENLLRMDSVTQVTAIQQAVGAGVMSPNEGRAKFDFKPVEGGKSPYLQQQNYSLEALAKRDAQDDPFKPNTAGSRRNSSRPTEPDKPKARPAKTRCHVHHGIKASEGQTCRRLRSCWRRQWRVWNFNTASTDTNTLQSRPLSHQ